MDSVATKASNYEVALYAYRPTPTENSRIRRLRRVCRESKGRHYFNPVSRTTFDAGQAVSARPVPDQMGQIWANRVAALDDARGSPMNTREPEVHLPAGSRTIGGREGTSGTPYRFIEGVHRTVD